MGIATRPPTALVLPSCREANMANLPTVEERMKQEFARKVQATTTTFVKAYEDFLTSIRVYFDRGYGAGGADPITDQDLSGLSFGADDLASIINMTTQLENFMTGQQVVPSEWHVPCSHVRSDI